MVFGRHFDPIIVPKHKRNKGIGGTYMPHPFGDPALIQDPVSINYLPFVYPWRLFGVDIYSVMHGILTGVMDSYASSNFVSFQNFLCCSPAFVDRTADCSSSTERALFQQH